MRIRSAWILPVLAMVALATATASVWAQSPYGPGGMPPGAGPMPGAYPAMAAFAQPPMGGGVPMAPGLAPGPINAAPMPGPIPGGMQGAMPIQGNPMMGGPMMGGPTPTGGPMMGPMSMGGPMSMSGPMSMGGVPPGMPETGGVMQAGFEGCPHCGGFGCGYCAGAGNDDFSLHLLDHLLPYAEGGICAPIWYDFHFEALFLKREDAGGNVAFASDGPAGFGPPLIVLATDDLSFDVSPGFKGTAAMHLGPGGSLEFGYMGLSEFSATAQVVSPLGELFSALSEFGSNPFLGFIDSDRSSFQSIEYFSTFDSFEMGFRKRFVGPNCRLHGSWMAGVRHFALDEQLVYRTRNTNAAPNGPGSMDYTVATYNALTGFQAGADAWVALIPGLRLGADLKGGIYGNRVDQGTRVEAASLGTPFTESVRGARASFLGEANLMMTWRLNYNLTFRGGYNLLYGNGLALAGENFNSQPPFVAGRTPTLVDNGEIFLHGFTSGIELMW